MGSGQTVHAVPGLSADQNAPALPVLDNKTARRLFLYKHALSGPQDADLLSLIERLDLSNITLVVQDWGGLLGLTLPHEMPQRFSRLLIMNTVLAMGTAPSQAFIDWRNYVAANPDMKVGALMKRATPILCEGEVAAYDAPFPDMTHKAGMRRFPAMVMTAPDMEGVNTSKRARKFWQEEWRGKSFMAVGAQDPVLGPPVMAKMQEIIAGCPEPFVVEEAGHFVQEWGREVAENAVAAFAAD